MHVSDMVNFMGFYWVYISTLHGSYCCCLTSVGHNSLCIWNLTVQCIGGRHVPRRYIFMKLFSYSLVLHGDFIIEAMEKYILVKDVYDCMTTDEMM